MCSYGGFNDLVVITLSRAIILNPRRRRRYHSLRLARYTAALPFRDGGEAGLPKASGPCGSADELIGNGFRQCLLQRFPRSGRTIPPARRQPFQFMPKILGSLQLCDAEG